MLLALWPAFMQRKPMLHGRLIDADRTHREIRSKETIKRTPSMLAAEAHLARLQVEAINGSINRDTSQSLDMGSLPGGVEPIGNASVRVSRHERPMSGSLPAALGASLATSDALPFELAAAMRQYAAKQTEEDDEMAIIILLTGM